MKDRLIVFNDDHARITNHLVTSTVTIVDPEPRTHAFTVRARGHVCGNIKYSIAVPDAGLLDGKYYEILRTNDFRVIGVSNGKNTTVDIRLSSGMQVCEKFMLQIKI